MAWSLTSSGSRHKGWWSMGALACCRKSLWHRLPALGAGPRSGAWWHPFLTFDLSQSPSPPTPLSSHTHSSTEPTQSHASAFFTDPSRPCPVTLEDMAAWDMAAAPVHPQRVLAAAVHEYRHKERMAAAEGDQYDLSRLLSLEGFTAGQWLEARLSDRRDCMAPLEWMVAARYRLGATQPIVPRGGRCLGGVWCLGSY